MFLYLKYYLTPRSKDIRELAMASAHEFWKGDTKIPKTIDTFQAYQRGYIAAHRSAYAKAQMEKLTLLNLQK